MHNYYFQYAKGITTSLLGGAYDFRSSSLPSVDKGNVFDFQYLTNQLVGLKQVCQVLTEVNQVHRDTNQKTEAPVITREQDSIGILNKNDTDVEYLNTDIKIVINYLLEIITTLADSNNQLISVLDPFATTLNQLNQAYPELTSDQITILKNLPQEIGNTLIPKATKPELQLYWASLLNMYHEVSNDLLESAAVLKKEINDISTQVAEINSIQAEEQNVFNGFQSFISTIQTPGNLLEQPEQNFIYRSLVNSCLQEVKILFSFAKDYDSVTFDYQDINKFLTSLLDTTLTEPSALYDLNYGQLITMEWAYTQLNTFLSENLLAQAGDIAKYFDQLVLALPNLENNTFLTVMEQQLKSISSEFLTTGNFSFWGASMTIVSLNGKQTLNSNFDIGIMQALNYQNPSLTSDMTNLSQTLNNINNNLQATVQQLQSKTTDLNLQLALLNISSHPYYKDVQEQFLLTLSLQTAFAVVMLDGFLPDQEYYLRMLCNELYFTDQSSKYFNSLLQQSSSFYNANIYYSLTRYLNQMNLSIIPNATENATAALNQEISRCIDDLSRLSNMKASLTAIQSQVSADSKLSEKDKQSLLSQLTDYSKNFDAASENLVNLKTLLLSLTIFPNDTNSNSQAFTVQGPSSWSQDLAHLESLVINGDQQVTYPGGLLNIQTQLESSQQTYSNENQDQQLVLQMELAAVQQQWTIVTTSLHIINQIYAGIVNKIGSN